MGIQNPVGKRFSFEGRQGWRHGTIVGVVKNFNFQSLHSKIEPFVMMIQPDRYNYFFLRIKTDTPDLSETLAFVENIWKKFVSNYPFESSFLDEEFESRYRAEQRTKKIFSYFSFIAMFISCLGLLGLSSFTAERRTKEIGIRKILGASVPGILIFFLVERRTKEIAIRKILGSSVSGVVYLLAKEITIWVTIANVIAAPVAYYFMKQWLQDFAYRIDLGVIPFVLAGISALMITWLPVSYQAIKAAIANPVESLRYE